MIDSPTLIARKRLKTLRAAVVAGILFALLYGASLVIICLSIPADLEGDHADWLQTNSNRIVLALNLVPLGSGSVGHLWRYYDDRAGVPAAFGLSLEIR